MATMKKTLTLCVAVTGLFLCEAAAPGSRPMLRVRARQARIEASLIAEHQDPLAVIRKQIAKKASERALEIKAKAAEVNAKLVAAALPVVVAAPMPAPAAAPAPAPAPMPMPAIPPIPPCNWTYDFEGVARPADCTNMTAGVVLPANHTCVRSANATFDDESTTCIPPVMQRCAHPVKNGDFPSDWFDELYSIPGVEEETIKHGQEFDIVCNENSTAVDIRYPLEAWGQDWYPGVKTHKAVCNNGTILRTDPTNMTFFVGHPLYRKAGIAPKSLRCALKEKVKLTQDIVSYLRWSEPRMMEAETKGYKWVDMDAILHKKLLKDAMNESSIIEFAARDDGELRDIPTLKRVIKALLDNRMLPRGEPNSQKTCKDLEKHWLYQLENSDPFKKANNIGFANWVAPANPKIGYPTATDVKLEKPIGFKCSYTLQKSAAGFDPYSRAMNYRYRDGCFCESQWTGGCPFRAELRPNYQTFGFDSVEIKGVSTAVGAATNALCWYFTKPANPEWGYLRSDAGYSYQAPASNVTELKRDYLKLRKLAQKARFSRT